MNTKSPLIAFLLSFIPGAGHFYLNRPVRGLLYMGGFFGSFLIACFALMTDADEPGIFLLFIAALFGFANMLDMIIAIINGKPFAPAVPTVASGYQASPHADYTAAGASYGGQPAYDTALQGTSHRTNGAYANHEQQQEKTRTILLSIIPGLGHMNLGLMQRGITFLVSFVGLFAIILFLSIIMNTGSLLVFLFALPVIWIYGIFDAVSIVQRKHNGEQLEDKSLFEGIEEHIASGHKNKVLTIALAIFPGAGHLYLGLQKRGLQLMGGFLLAIFIMDNMRLSLFLFLLPLFWCFAFFDALNQLSKYGHGHMNDEPVLPMFVPYQRWFGIGLIGFGIYFLVDRIVVGELHDHFPEISYQYTQYKYMFPTAVIAFVMIVLGLRLAFGRRSLLSAGVLENKRDPFNDEERGARDEHDR
jgi:TM2 domain-containing membrane protein YozV